MLNNDLYSNMYNPDVLSTLANLSSDEVFTPPEIANQMLDLLPEDLWSDPETTFLDPACKSGVFLREIAKRLIDGLEDEIPDLQERLDHIFHNQIYGIAITELTSLLSRRSTYGSKYANSIFSFSEFDNPIGNIKFNIIEHMWDRDRCKYCGASKSEYDRREDLETHAYEFIHRKKIEEIFNMKFDVIIGNPPYQLSTGGTKSQATPIYNKFVDQAKKLKPRYLVMIIPSRWFAGGMGLSEFRRNMLNDTSLKEMVDYTNAKDCFPGISLGGGVNYFLWDRDYSGPCNYTNIHDGIMNTKQRILNEYEVFIRFNEGYEIIKKVKSLGEKTMDKLVSSLSPFGLNSSERGRKARENGDLVLYSSGGKGYINKNKLTKGTDYIGKYNIMMSKTTSEHAGEPDKDGKFKVISRIQILKPSEVCTFSYFLIGNDSNKNNIKNMYNYLSTKFVRFLLLQAITSINISKDKFMFIPLQDFSKSWTDEELYKKYDLNQEEIDFIESMIKPME